MGGVAKVIFSIVFILDIQKRKIKLLISDCWWDYEIKEKTSNSLLNKPTFKNQNVMKLMNFLNLTTFQFSQPFREQ